VVHKTTRDSSANQEWAGLSLKRRILPVWTPLWHILESINYIPLYQTGRMEVETTSVLAGL
jgi:hypothetical protein